MTAASGLSSTGTMHWVFWLLVFGSWIAAYLIVERLVHFIAGPREEEEPPTPYDWAKDGH